MAVQAPPGTNGWVSGPHIAFLHANGMPTAHLTWTPVQSPSSNTFHLPRNNSFHLFSKLPPELRLKIWSYAAPPRVIELRSWGNTTTHSSYQPIKFSAGPHRLPIIFGINRESRQEALRLYDLVEIGVSVTAIDPRRKYVPWRYHPANRNAIPDFYGDGSYPIPKALPYRPQRTYVCWSRDTVYLGPDFQLEHLETFMCATGAELELPGLQYLALDRHLWLGPTWWGQNHQHWEPLRKALYSLHTRPVKELYIVPDDVKGALEDRWYYGKHEIKLVEPECAYTLQLAHNNHGPVVKGVVENLLEWFVRLWREGWVNERVMEGEMEGPRVSIMSLRRNTMKMEDYRHGVWEIQMKLGDMAYWRAWTPPEQQPV